MKKLQDEGFTVIAVSKDLGNLKKINAKGIKTYSLPMTRQINPLAIMVAIVKVYRLIKKERIDILHVHTPIASFIGRIAATLARVRIKIYTVHGFTTGNRFFMFIEKVLAKSCTDYILTVNSEDHQLADEQNFLTSGNIINIQSVGINTDQFNPDLFSSVERKQQRKELCIYEEAQVIGYVGRIVAEKGVLDLLAAYLKIRQNRKLKLLLIGPWDWGERDNKTIAKVKEIIHEHNLEQEVYLLGEREDIPQLLSIIDIFVLPSYREGMPVSLLEAMAMEIPVIATNIRGCREEVDSTSGFLYEPKDVDSLAKQLTYLLDNQEIAKQMGKHGRERVVEHFSEQQVLERQMKVYCEIIKTNELG